MKGFFLCSLIFVLGLVQGQVIQTDVLAYVNNYRRLHDAPPVMYDTSLETGAVTWAGHLAVIQSLVHSVSNGTYGENLGVITNSATAWQHVIDLWYAEGTNYDYAAGQFSATAGHFTQLVWKATTAIGIGQALDSQGLLWVVMRFHPAGNVVGGYVKNVGPLVGGATPPPLVVQKPPPPLPLTQNYKCRCTC